MKRDLYWILKRQILHNNFFANLQLNIYTKKMKMKSNLIEFTKTKNNKKFLYFNISEHIGLIIY